MGTSTWPREASQALSHRVFIGEFRWDLGRPLPLHTKGGAADRFNEIIISSALILVDFTNSLISTYCGKQPTLHQGYNWVMAAKPGVLVDVCTM